MNDGTLFPIAPEDYDKLKSAIKVFGGTARVYDTTGSLIEDPERYKGVPELSALESTVKKDDNSPR